MRFFWGLWLRSWEGVGFPPSLFFAIIFLVFFGISCGRLLLEVAMCAVGGLGAGAARVLMMIDTTV